MKRGVVKGSHDFEGLMFKTFGLFNSNDDNMLSFAIIRKV